MARKLLENLIKIFNKNQNAKNRSRKKQSIINIISSLCYQLTTTILGFITRTIFIHTLGESYLGINSLFTNILSVLSLTELGIGTAMTYSMYEPLANNNQKKLSALSTYFTKIYYVLSVVVLLIGIVLIPFLKYIVNLETNIIGINFYYLLYLSDTVVSYLCVSKTAILIADQNDYIIKIIRSVLSIVKLVLQILCLTVFKSFFAFLLVQIATSMVGNLLSAWITKRKYYYIQSSEYLDEISKKEIWSNVKDMFSYKVGGVILNNTDQILISIIVGTVIVGLYSNYLMIVTAITGFTSAIFISIQASIGNLTVNTTFQKQYEIFKVIDLLSFWIYGFCSFCFVILFQDFVQLWLGTNYMLSDFLVVIVATNYYITGILYPIWCYRETVGLFKQTKNILFYASIINIFLSILLGKLFGIEGILSATIIARCSTNIWLEPKKLFQIYFKQKVSKYYFEKIIQVIILIGIITMAKIGIYLLSIESLKNRLVIEFMICIVVPFISLYLYSRNRDEFKYLINSISIKKLIKVR